MNINLSNWDLLLIGVVTTQSALLSWLKQPKQKALVLMMPVPFTCAMLAVRRPVDATHMLGLANLMTFILLVRYFHVRRGWSIVGVIAGCIVLYCAIGTGIAQSLPIEVATAPPVFYGSLSAVIVYCICVKRLLPMPHETVTRTIVSMSIKLPIIAAVSTSLVLIKQLLAGFVATFPFVTTVGAYEARHCLTTIAASFPRFVIIAAAMMVTVREVELATSSRGGALAAGWCTFSLMMLTSHLLARRSPQTVPLQ